MSGSISLHYTVNFASAVSEETPEALDDRSVH
jgi:hypothetical protein